MIKREQNDEVIKKLNLFLNYLSSKFNYRVSIEKTKRPYSFYLPAKNTIYLSNKDINNNSLEELCYVISHEYKHALLNNEKDHFKENLWLLSKYSPYFLLFLINIYLHHVFSKDDILLYIFFGLFGLPLIILVNNPFWYNQRKFKEEEVCDEFANKWVGYGASYWHKKMDDSMKDHIYLRIQNILTMGLYSPTHPRNSARLIQSQLYNPNPDLARILN